jgi:hypothetical protein
MLHPLWLGRMLLAGAAMSLLAPDAAGQGNAPAEAKVKAATRLDWQFVASLFGADQPKLPDGYDSSKQRYQLYVPKNYDKAKAWPLVVFVSPGDDPGGWGAWKKVCEEQGVLFCAPFGAGNNCPIAQRCRIVLDTFDDVRKNYKIDPDRTYLSGFSGGARMACTIGCALPQYFGGIVPICGTNPLPKLSYLKHRIRDRLAVAHVTGETDFNRKEHEVYMHPWWQALGITSKLWLVPKLGHGVPSADALMPVYKWLDEQLPQRQTDALENPKLVVGPGETPTGEQEAQRMLDAADAALQKPELVWRGVTLLQGVTGRWPKSAPAKAAQTRLQAVLKDEAKLQRVEEQGGAEERKFLVEQAKALERFGDVAKAIQSWQMVVELHPFAEEARLAAKELERLRRKKE